ncbi:MAG TPA: ABC transporter permease [Rugosimonospora sp.]|nr:ABC transporter permease [Rugosimonospora sp.]
MALAEGVIHDIGYQRYSGPRLGRRYAAGSLYTHSLRTAFGLGRTAKAKIFPFIVVGLAFGVAAVAVALRANSGKPVISYLQYCDSVGIPLLLFVAIAAPELVSRDLRAKVLPLYFSRPLRRTDYALVKLAATVSAMWLVLAGPLLLMFLGGVFSQTNGASGAWHEFTDLLGGWSYAMIYAVIFCAIGVLVASLAGRRAVAAAAVVGVFLVPTPVVGVLQVLGGPMLRQLSRMIDPVLLIQGLSNWIYRTHTMNIDGYGPVYLGAALVLVGGCVSLLVVRYRRLTV